MHFFRLMGVASLIIYIPTVIGVNFKACLEEVHKGLWGPDGGTDSHGHPVGITKASGTTYDLCVRACGAGPEPFEWSVFSQQFASWLLPWLALLSQLPYGANNKFENLVSMLLTVGSPALAAYSLALTALNGRWISRQLAQYRRLNPSLPVLSAIRVLTILQQYPLVVNTGGMLISLITLSENKVWWDYLVDRLNHTPRWTTSAVTSMAWVLIAYIFTIVDSFTSDITNSINSNGQGIGSQWLWLMPIVAGWLQISPQCESVLLNRVMKDANEMVYVTHHGRPTLARTVSIHRAIRISLNKYDNVRRDEYCTIPIYNYARFLSWAEAADDVSYAFRVGSQRLNKRYHSIARDKEIFKPDHRAATVRLNGLLPPGDLNPSRRALVLNGVLRRFFFASFFALLLQWGTTGAAVMVHLFTPTNGIGCRTASYLLYGTVSTLVWMMLVASSFLAHYSTRIAKMGTVTKSALISRSLSITLRRLGKVIASLNALWIVTSSIFQFTNFFDRCWCNSSVLELRDKAYNVIDHPHSDLIAMRNSWIGGVAIACISSLVFIISVLFM